MDFHVGKKQLKQILEKVINTHGASATAEVLDHVKSMGYKLSTRAAMTVSISDMTVPPQKPVNQLKDGGIYVTSGIIEDKEETVKAAVEAAGLTVLEVHHQGEWVSVTVRKETKA